MKITVKMSEKARERVREGKRSEVATERDGRR